MYVKIIYFSILLSIENNVTILYGFRAICTLFEVEYEIYEIDFIKCIVWKNKSLKYIKKYDSEEYRDKYDVWKNAQKSINWIKPN